MHRIFADRLMDSESKNFFYMILSDCILNFQISLSRNDLNLLSFGYLEDAVSGYKRIGNFSGLNTILTNHLSIYNTEN